MQESLSSAKTSMPSLSLGEKIFRLLNHRAIKKFDGIPGPTPSFPLGTAADFQGKLTWEVLGAYGREFGGISLMWMLFNPSVILNDPTLIGQVLLTLEQQKQQSISRCPVTQALNFYKDLPRKALRPMLTDSSTFIAKDQGPEWQELSNESPFNASYFEDWINQQLDPLAGFIQGRVSQLESSQAQDSETLPAYDTLQKLTFDGFSMATVGQVLPDEAFAEFCEMCEVGTQRMNRSSLSNALIPKFPFGRHYRRVSQQWFNRFEQIVAQGHDAPPSISLLSWILTQTPQFPATQLRNFLAGVYPGGAISAPSGTTSALYFLWKHLEFLPPLVAEVEALLSAPLTYKALNSSPLLDQVVRETLRLSPPVAFFTRNVGPEDVHLGNHRIPAHTQIFINNWYLHRHPEYWQDPDRFNPCRWDSQTCEQNPYGSGYFFPFGRGDRACIGQTFAKIFMKLSLAVILKEKQVDFGSESNAPEFYFAVSVPRKLRMTLRDR